MNFSGLTTEELEMLYVLLGKVRFMSGRAADNIHIMCTAIDNEITRRNKK